ncbi:MAG: hypothetical protein Q9210_001048 [Variospora velana]
MKIIKAINQKLRQNHIARPTEFGQTFPHSNQENVSIALVIPEEEERSVATKGKKKWEEGERSEVRRRVLLDRSKCIGIKIFFQ